MPRGGRRWHLCLGSIYPPWLGGAGIRPGRAHLGHSCDGVLGSGKEAFLCVALTSISKVTGDRSQNLDA